MRKPFFAAVAAVFVLSVVLAHAQGRFDDVEIKTTHVAGKVYMLEGSGGNMGAMVGSDGVLLVDDQFAELSDRIVAALKKLGGGSPAYVLNTHYHGDHVSGNPVFGAEATIIAHPNVRKRLEKGSERAEPMSGSALPVITFDHSLSVHFNGEEVRAIHLPTGHTDGDCVVYFTGSNVLHMGDHVFTNLFPYVDLDGGGNVQGYLDNIEHILGEVPADVKIIAGHGELTDVTVVRAWRNLLIETVDIIRAGMEAGKNLEALKQEGLPEKYLFMNWSFISTERWIETVYNGYSK
jgi:glyoxylase-like metal-dependent hydrolase (beta-lactamase superfamily II)